MKRVALSLALLLFILSATTVQSLEPKDNTISSYGIVNSATHKLWWGVTVSDAAWEPWGSYFCRTQIDLLKQSGATAIRIMLDKNAWYNRDVGNILGITFPDYIKQLVEWCKPEIKVLLDLTRDTSNPSWITSPGWTAELEIITSSPLRTEWINWGKEVISYCKPDAIGIMNEPGGDGETTSFDYYYDNFVIPSINAYRSIDPNISIFVMGMPFYDLNGYVDRPINDDKVFYQYHFYYDYPPNPKASQLQKNLCNAYGEGRLSEARNYLNQFFDWKFTGLPKLRIHIAECGPKMTKGQTVPSIPNWDAFLIDTYDYAKQHLNGLFQYGFTKGKYLMLYPSTSYSTFTPYGQLWAQNCPG